MCGTVTKSPCVRTLEKEGIVRRWIPALAAMVAVNGIQLLAAQGLADLRKLYDAGQYQQVVDAAGRAELPEDQQPRVAYLVAQSHQKLSHIDAARRSYEQLAARSDADPWQAIGASAVALLSSNPAGALESANQAVARDESVPEAHYQRGLALSVRQDMAAAAGAFEKASELDPTWAYAHYYAGLAYSKIKRIDVMASHFDTFLKLAPQAPERLEVQSIMKTLAGKD
jgi:tetratricopeptide (TPR) repeat protein